MGIKKYVDKFPSFEGKRIIVTGANSGVGYELCLHLLSKKASIVMACRSEKRATAAKNEMLKQYPDGDIDILIYDQSSFESIKKASEIITSKYQDFYGLVCNAGILGPINGGEFTKEGFPITCGTNYIGLLYLYECLLPFLNASQIKRKIIFQGSLAAGLKVKKGLDICEDNASQWQKYNLSKRCVEILFKYASDYNQNENIDYLLCEPGVSATSLFNSMNGFLRVVGGFFIKVMCHSPKKASLTMLKCLDPSTKNKEVYLPRGIYRINGYPKRFKFKEKRYNPWYLERGKECIKSK